MSDILKALDDKMTALQAVKDLLKENNLDAWIKYYEKGYHRWESLQEVTSKVNESVEQLLTNVFGTRGCEIHLCRQEFEDAPVEFQITIHSIGVNAATIEMPERTVYISSKAIQKQIERASVQRLQEITKTCMNIETAAQAYGFDVLFT